MMRLARNDDGLGGQELIMASADDRVIPVILPLPHPGRAACGARESTQIDRCARHTHQPDRCAHCEQHKLIEFQVSDNLPSDSRTLFCRQSLDRVTIARALAQRTLAYSPGPQRLCSNS